MPSTLKTQSFNISPENKSSNFKKTKQSNTGSE